MGWSERVARIAGRRRPGRALQQVFPEPEQICPTLVERPTPAKPQLAKPAQNTNGTFCEISQRSSGPVVYRRGMLTGQPGRPVFIARRHTLQE
jgi:hypothetical protein